MHTIFRTTVLSVAASSLIGCSKEATTAPQELAISVPAEYSAELKQMLNATWPKVLRACPGLNDYASDLSFVGIDENLKWAPQDAQRVEVRFKIGGRGRFQPVLVQVDTLATSAFLLPGLSSAYPSPHVRRSVPAIVSRIAAMRRCFDFTKKPVVPAPRSTRP